MLKFSVATAAPTLAPVTPKTESASAVKTPPLAKQDYIDVAQLENLQGVLLTVPKDRENTEKYYQSLMNYFGNFITPPICGGFFLHNK